MPRRFAAVALCLATVGGILLTPASPSSADSSIVVGVVQSQASKNYAAGVPPHPFSQGYDITGRENAALSWATDEGYTVVTLTDADLANRVSLDAVDVVIMPYTVAMNESASMTVRDWVHDGGAIIPILASPRFFLDDQGQWDLWILEMNYEAWEWGPISEAYQMQFVNDPNVPQWDAHVSSGHPIGSDALAAVGAASARFRRPSPGTGVEFGYPFNDNVDPFLTYGNLTGSESVYNGWSAAQAVQYGHGRIVYFNVPLIDFLPVYNSTLSAVSAGAGVTNGELADAVLAASVDWATTDGGYVPVNPVGTTYGEVDVWGDAIYVRQYVGAEGEFPVLGSAYARVYKPDGSLWMTHVKPKVGVEPGGERMYSWSFLNHAPLDNGSYRVEVEYTYTYPDYDESHFEEVYVVRSQGTNIPTVEVEDPFALDFSDFDPVIHPTGGTLGVTAPGGTAWTVTVAHRDGSGVVLSESGTGDDSISWGGTTAIGPYLVTGTFSGLGSTSRFIQVGDYEWPFVDDEGSYARTELEEMWDRGLTIGCDWNKYCPDDQLTRVELATILARSMNPSGNWPSYHGYYGDVAPGHWYTGPIEYLVEQGILPGGPEYGVGYFASRALLVDLLMPVLGQGSYGSYQGYFTDVGPSDWFREKVERAYEMGIALGYPDGTFRPYSGVTREEAAALLMRGL